MKKNIRLCIILAIVCMVNVSAREFPGTVSSITDQGAWCWFADPRAISFENESGTINCTYIGYIDVHGNIKATQINHLTGQSSEVLVRSWFQPDDHNNPTFLVLPDERIMIFYSRHTDERCFYYRISQKPGDITTLGKEIRLETTHNTTYPSPFILPDDPEHIYLCWRGINWHPTMGRLTLPDKNDHVTFDWGPHQLVRSQKGSGGVRPYAKYKSNGKDKIYMAYTTTHPDNQPVNYIYFNYIDINTRQLEDIKGRKLAMIGSDTLHQVDATQTYKNAFPDAVVDDSPYRNWLWEISEDPNGYPAMATVSISPDKKSHDYYHIRWTGEKWEKTFIAQAGGHFHQTPNVEMCYSGGMAIDKDNPQIIYASVPVEGKHGRIYELMKYTVSLDGTVTSIEQITSDSPRNNIRPFAIANKRNTLQLAWMYGEYYDWIVSSSRPQGFPTAIKTNMPLPAGKIELEKGLIKEKGAQDISQKKNIKIKVPRSEAFTLVLDLFMDDEQEEKEILRAGILRYGISATKLPKPYVVLGKQTYESTNVLGTADSWQKHGRGTGGQWHAPEKLKAFQLILCYADGQLRTYIDGRVDQYIETAPFSIAEIQVGGFEGKITSFKVYDRALLPNEIHALLKTSSPAP